MLDLSSQLWNRIESCQIGDGAVSYSFVQRLADENRWTTEFAHRALEEYRRFVFLAMTAEHEVTPSLVVDAVWHLHLTYTQSYWDDFCSAVLNRRLHHVPTRGGMREAERHAQQYVSTLQHYENSFGGAPPADIWPRHNAKASVISQNVNVDLRRVWIIPKPDLPNWLVRRRSVLTAALIAPFVFGLTSPLDFSGPDFLKLYVVLCFVGIAAAMIVRRICRRGQSIEPIPDLSAEEIACLGGGAPLAIRACIASLIADGRLYFKTKDTGSKSNIDEVSLGATRKPSMTKSEMEKPILELAHDPYGATLKQLLNAGLPAALTIRSKLTAQGLLESSESFATARWTSVLLLSAIWIFGATKVIVGIDRDRPVGLLLAILVVMACVIILFWSRPLRTLRGNTIYRTLQERHRLPTQYVPAVDSADSSNIDANSFAMAGLFGLAAVSHPDVDRLRKSLRANPTVVGGGCGSAFACSGGGCGHGGCGGGGACGGCGGGGH